MVRSLLFPSVESWSLLPQHAVFVWPNHYKTWAIPVNIIIFEILMLSATFLLFWGVRKYIFSHMTYRTYCKIQGLGSTIPTPTIMSPRTGTSPMTSLQTSFDEIIQQRGVDMDMRSPTMSMDTRSRTTSDADMTRSRGVSDMDMRPRTMTEDTTRSRVTSDAELIRPPVLDLDLIRARTISDASATDMIAPISPTHTTVQEHVFPVPVVDAVTEYQEWSTPRVFAVCWPILETMVRPSVVITLVTLFQCLDFQLYIALFILSYCHELGFLYYWRRWYPRQHLVFMTRHHILALAILTLIYIMLHVPGTGMDFPYPPHDPHVETLVFRGGYLFILWEWAFVCMAVQQLYTEYLKYQHDMHPQQMSSLAVYTGRRNSAIVCRIGFMIWTFGVYVCSLFLPDVTYSLYLLPVVPGFLMNCFDTYYTLRSIQRLTKKMKQLQREQTLKLQEIPVMAKVNPPESSKSVIVPMETSKPLTIHIPAITARDNTKEESISSPTSPHVHCELDTPVSPV